MGSRSLKVESNGHGLRWQSLGRKNTSKLIIAGLIFICGYTLLYEVCTNQKARNLVQELQRDQQHLAKAFSTGSLPQNVRPATVQKQNPGIIICAGGNQLLINTYVSVKVLRASLKSELPIEIYHVGPEDVGPVTRKIFEEFKGVKFIDLKELDLPDIHREPRIWKSYMWKIFSLYNTNFEQVLLLDADSQPLRDPSFLFASEEFQKKGNLFWSDFWGPHTSEETVYKWLGLQAPWFTNADWSCGESGQVLFDKTKHADVLEWLWFLNSHAELLYDHMLGDKDTFEMAFMLANKHSWYQRISVLPGIPFSGPIFPVYHQKWISERFRFKHESTRYLRLGMLQYGPDNLPAFIHRTERTKFANWRNGYDRETMRPQYFLPSMGPNVTTWEKKLIWNAHSFPVGMVDFNGDHCTLNQYQRQILIALGQDFLTKRKVLQNCWYSRGGVPQHPVFGIQMLGKQILNSISASLTAYQELEHQLGKKIMWKKSP